MLAGLQVVLWCLLLNRLALRILRQEGSSSVLCYLLPQLTALIASAVTFSALFQAARFFGLICFSLLP